MKKNFILLILLLINLSLYSQNYVLPLWDIGNDNFSPRRNLLLNSSFTSRYNFNNKIQLASQLPLMPILPNVQAKIRLWNHYKDLHKKVFFNKLHFSITSVHTAVFPHYGLTLLSKTGLVEIAKPFLSPNLTLNNELLLSFYANSSKVCNYTGNKITIKVGLRNTLGNDYTLTLPVSPFWYLTNSTFKFGYLYYLGIVYDLKIFNNLNLSSSLKWIKLHADTQFLESYSFFYFGFGYNKRSAVAIGYIADFMVGTKKFSIIPGFNLSYKLHKRAKSDIDKYLRY